MTDPSLWLQIAALVVLLVFSAFFSMSETALTRTNSALVKDKADKGNRAANRLVGLLREPERVLSMILVGNNLVNIAAASLATVVAVKLWGTQGVLIATFGLTAVVLLFAEITPKTLAVQHSEATALRLSGPLRVADIVLRPAAYVMNKVAGLLLRMVGVRTDVQAPFVTQKEIEAMIKVGAEEGEVEQFEQQIIEEVFDFTDTQIGHVITPWDHVNYLPKETLLRDALEMVKETGHSRIPIVDGDFEHVMGFVHAKDLLKHTDEQLAAEPVTDELRAVLFTRHDMPADKILARMQRERKLMAIVQDEEGRNMGIATVEDLVEELIGEIRDEFDDIEAEIAADPSRAEG